MTLQPAILIPWLPALSAGLCGLCCVRKSWRRLAAPLTIGAIFASFLLAVLVSPAVKPFDPAEPDLAPHVVTLFSWIHVGDFRVDMAYFLDPLTLLMLMVVCGVGTLVAVYAAGYMAGDRGYARFFAGVSLFIFAMTTLVMADNLVLLYLGWEGVGLCSYLLIGFYYQKPSAVAAAKKAFIVNRIGDLGFALGIFLIYSTFHTVSLAEVLSLAHHVEEPTTAHLWIPFLLMLGAFGKSAQIPLYVWLPDAMEGPTPVSALIHAATMVTAGVYMIARLLPVFELSPYALPTVAIVGAVTALFAATIALCQYDLKRIYAYSTISQLGYMFLGVGVLSTVGGMFHLFTHAFFKALLFLTAGSVMHALAGQLDLRKISGLRTRMPITCLLMLFGCLALAGFPFTAGFFSKDLILADVLVRGLSLHQPLYTTLAVVGLVTAFLTAFYTFRLWFRVFLGPTRYELGDEHHAADGAHAAGHAADAHDIKIEHVHDAHEMPWLMNAPLVVLAVGALFAGLFCKSWLAGLVTQSSAAAAAAHSLHAHATLCGYDPHLAMEFISSAVAVLGIAAAAYFHWLNRPAADSVAARYRGLVSLLNHKYYVDEIYDALIVRPLRALGGLCFVLDRLIVEGLVALVGFLPRLLGLGLQPTQQGALQGYGLGMAAGIAILALLIALALGT
ncbi:MAG: NADH-quinone oxidoreductase subunit L [Phycisphaeraceae bacterium]|nr:NADH-quinone oxidoreductase subunit L [Phycisphaeraceae bacterium]